MLARPIGFPLRITEIIKQKTDNILHGQGEVQWLNKQSSGVSFEKVVGNQTTRVNGPGPNGLFTQRSYLTREENLMPNQNTLILKSSREYKIG